MSYRVPVPSLLRQRFHASQVLISVMGTLYTTTFSHNASHRVTKSIEHRVNLHYARRINSLQLEPHISYMK